MIQRFGEHASGIASVDPRNSRKGLKPNALLAIVDESLEVGEQVRVFGLAEAAQGEDTHEVRAVLGLRDGEERGHVVA